MAKKKTKKAQPKNVGGRPARREEASRCRVEVRCTRAELDEYTQMAKDYAGGDRAAMFRDAVTEYVAARKKRRAAKRKRPAAVVTDLVVILLIFALLVLRFGLPTFPEHGQRGLGGQPVDVVDQSEGPMTAKPEKDESEFGQDEPADTRPLLRYAKYPERK